MKAVICATCGIKTTNPYVINGQPFCVDDAEQRAPGLVRDRVRKDWRYWNGNRGAFPYKTRND